MSVRIGKYEVEAELGHSAPVRGFRAFDRDTGRRVTLKVLAEAADRALAARFRREVAAAANLRHPNVIAVYELGEHVGFPFAAMQHLGDDTLAHAIAKHASLTLLEKMRMMGQVADGLHAAHGGGLPYVGIRPSGIALAGGAVTVHDFGIVRLSDERDGDAAAYLAPGEERGAPADIFAFGIIYHELLTGTRPAAAGDLRLRELAPDCPQALERLVARALESDPELRYQSLDDLRFDAEPVLRELRRARAAELAAEAQGLLDRQDPDGAHRVLREALDLDPDNAAAHRLRAALRDMLQRRSVRPRLEGLLRDAEQEAAAGRYERAAEILRAALRLDGADPEASGRLEHVRLRLEQSRRSTQLVAEARELLARNAVADARAKATEAIESDPRNSAAAELLRDIDEAAKRRETDAKIERELARAKSLLLRQSFDEAISALAALRDAFPGSPEVGQWLAHVEAQKAEAERHKKFQAWLEEARSLLARGKFAEAAALLEELAAEFPAGAQLPDLLSQARQGLERASAVAQALDESEWLVAQDRPDLAARFLEEKAAALDHPDLVAKYAAVRDMLPGWEQRRLAREALARSAALEHLQQWDAALTVLDEALQAAPGSAELLEAAARLRSQLREQERRRKLARRLDAIGQKIAARAWPQALALIESAEAEFPGARELELLRQEVRDCLRASECDAIASEVRQCLADGDADQAGEVLRKGIESLGEDPALLALRGELEAEKKYREEWRAAQVLFGRRHFHDAEAILLRLAGPDRPDAQALLQAVRDARAAAEEEHFYTRGRENALKLMEQGQFEQAAGLLRNLLSLFPGDPILERDLQSALRGAGTQPPEDAAIGEPEDEPPDDDPPAAQPAITADEPAAAPPDRKGVRVVLPGRLPWPAIAAVGSFLLFSTPAALWTLTRAPSRTRTVAAAPPAKPPAVSAPAAAAAPPTPAQPAPVQPSAVAVPHPKPSGAARAATPRPFNPPALTSAAAVQIAPPPAAVPVVPDGAKAALAAGILPQAAAPPLPAADGQRIIGDPGPGAVRDGSAYVLPKSITRTAPEVPLLARQRGIYGVVELEAVVDRRGQVSEVRILSGNAILAQAARNAVLRWRYEPALLHGQPVESRVPVKVNFEARR